MIERIRGCQCAPQMAPEDKTQKQDTDALWTDGRGRGKWEEATQVRHKTRGGECGRGREGKSEGVERRVQDAVREPSKQDGMWMPRRRKERDR